MVPKMVVACSGTACQVSFGVGTMQRVGGVIVAHSGPITYEQIGDLHRYSQTGKSKSLRRDRVIIKKMLRASSEAINGH